MLSKRVHPSAGTMLTKGPHPYTLDDNTFTFENPGVNTWKAEFDPPGKPIEYLILIANFTRNPFSYLFILYINTQCTVDRGAIETRN